MSEITIPKDSKLSKAAFALLCAFAGLGVKDLASQTGLLHQRIETVSITMNDTATETIAANAEYGQPLKRGAR